MRRGRPRWLEAMHERHEQHQARPDAPHAAHGPHAHGWHERHHARLDEAFCRFDEALNAADAIDPIHPLDKHRMKLAFRAARLRKHRSGLLQRRLFMTFGVAIAITMLTSAGVFYLFYGSERTTLSHAALAIARAVAFCVAGCFLWMISGGVARKLAAPLRELTRVASDLGAGRLESRVRLPHHDRSEIGELAMAFNDMASRIETQIKSQKELLGAVSHELRTPLARMRVLLAMLQDEGANPDVASKVEREIVEMDQLVGELLAGARVDAGALSRRKLEVVDLLGECVERACMHEVELDVAPDACNVNADATLVSRALMVLLDNAKKHGAGRVRIDAKRDGELLRICVEDDGRGFADEDLPQVFAPFVRGQGAAPDEARGVGLGLYLVRRIAEAHSGSAFAENRSQGGARVGFTLRDA